ncbi:hypothetical protein IJG44_03440 [bacterium]|nr:hypothetical protein [bacterium]
MKILHFGKLEQRHDNSCCDKQHFFGGFFCPEMLDHYKCSQINSDYTSGTAVCNSTCSGYNENNCSTSDGWF